MYDFPIREIAYKAIMVVSNPDSPMFQLRETMKQDEIKYHADHGYDTTKDEFEEYFNSDVFFNNVFNAAIARGIKF